MTVVAINKNTQEFNLSRKFLLKLILIQARLA